MTGLRIISVEEQLRNASPTAWIAGRRLGLTADRSRVVDYYSTEAAFLFRAEGKPVTVAESERYGIGPDHPFSPRPSVKLVPATPDPDEIEGKSAPPAAKEAARPDNKMAEPPANKGAGKKARR